MGKISNPADATAEVQTLVAPPPPFRRFCRFPGFSGFPRPSNPAQMGDLMPTCPRCESSERQVKAGLNRTGTQRFLCRTCGRSYTPEPKPAGYEESVRRKSLMLYAGGMSVRAASRFAGVSHQTAANWVEEACALRKESEEAADTLILKVAARRGMVLQAREWRQPNRQRSMACTKWRGRPYLERV